MSTDQPCLTLHAKCLIVKIREGCGGYPQYLILFLAGGIAMFDETKKGSGDGDSNLPAAKHPITCINQDLA